MNSTFNEFEIAARAPPHGRVAVLLLRYPHVAGREVDEIVAFLNGARPAEIGRLAAIDAIGPQLERFMKDHRHRIGGSATEAILAGLSVILVLLIFWLL